MSLHPLCNNPASSTSDKAIPTSLVPEEDYAVFQLNAFKISVVYAQYPYEFKGLSRHQQC